MTGITGQDGSYLAEFLLSKGYVVHGTVMGLQGDNSGASEDVNYMKESITPLEAYVQILMILANILAAARLSVGFILPRNFSKGFTGK